MNLREDIPPNEPLTGDQQVVRLITYVIAFCFIVLIAIMGSCTAHSNTFDAARLQEEVKIEAQKASVKRERTLAIERLVDKGEHPIAARCAVEGWNRNYPETCRSTITKTGESNVD